MPKVYSTGDQVTASDFNAVVKTTGLYAADAGGTDDYAITVSPAPTSYVAGDVFRFKANTANTGAATLNVNSLGAKTIKKNGGADDLSTGDIKAGQYVEVQYDGTNFQMLSPSGIQPMTGANVQTFTVVGANTWTKPSFGNVALIRVWGGGGGGAVHAASAGSGGGGGGGFVERLVALSDLGATESVNVGQGGASVPGAGANTIGNNGNSTTFGSGATLITAYGGGGGGTTSTTTGGGGGGGGSFLGAVPSATPSNGDGGVGAGWGVAGDVGGWNNVNGKGNNVTFFGSGLTGGGNGQATVSQGVDSLYGGGGGGGAGNIQVGKGGNSFWGGGGGGSTDLGYGGNSVWGGAGGGGGGNAASTPTNRGISLFGGNGGNGGNNTVNASNGSQPGGGGGGARNGTSGNGGNGQVTVIVW